jgi:hypothetical protein
MAVCAASIDNSFAAGEDDEDADEEDDYDGMEDDTCDQCGGDIDSDDQFCRHFGGEQ